MNSQELQKLILDLQNGNDKQRRIASYRLGKSKNPEAVPALILACNDSDGSVRLNAIFGLQKIGSEDAIAFLDSKGINVTKSQFGPTSNLISFFIGMTGWITFTLLVNSIFYNSKNLVTFAIITLNHLIGFVLTVITFHLKKRAVGVGILSAIALFVIFPLLLISLGVFSGDVDFLAQHF